MEWLFFILSGFVMALGYSIKANSSSFKFSKYIIHRLIRIYPLHILCLCYFILLSLRNVDCSFIVRLIPNILLLQSWSLNPDIYFSGNAVSWCLSDLMFFYCLFPILAHYIERYKKISFYIFLLTICVYLSVISIIPDNFRLGIIYINPVMRTLDFSLGIFLFHFYEYICKHQSYISLPAIFIMQVSSIVVTVILIIYYSLIPEAYALASYWWLPLVILIASFSIANNESIENQRLNIFKKILSQKLFVLFGNASYSFYLIHTMGITTISLIFEKLNINLSPYFQLSITLAIIMVISIFIYQGLEKPISNYLLSKFKSTH